MFCQLGFHLTKLLCLHAKRKRKKKVTNRSCPLRFSSEILPQPTLHLVGYTAPEGLLCREACVARLCPDCYYHQQSQGWC